MTARTCPALPARIAALPKCPRRGLPVPFSSGLNGDGTGRFGTNDTALKLVCAIAGLCSVCAEPIGDGEPHVFLAADLNAGEAARLLFTDPPAHEDCAAASLSLCPYIASARVPSRHHPGAGKPGWLWLAAAGYELGPGQPPGVSFTFRPVPPLVVRRFSYTAAGTLAEVTEGTEATP